MTPNTEKEVPLKGGMMNVPVRVGSRVHRPRNDSSETTQKLLAHLRSKGLDWAPEPLGFDEKGREVLSYIEGEVPHEMPEWVWSDDVLRDIAQAMRKLHDATVDFPREGCVWQLNPGGAGEVICHHDFAPYNSVFREGRFVGLLDFEMCGPGSRLWDMTYTAYRFIPLQPQTKVEEHDEVSPFSEAEMNGRIELFLDAYESGDKPLRFGREKLLAESARRMRLVAKWTDEYARENDVPALARNSKMYARHAEWLRGQAGKSG